MKKTIIFITVLIIIAFQAARWYKEAGWGERGYVISLISDQRRYCQIYFPSTLCALSYNKLEFYPVSFLKNYLTALSLNYLFLQHKLFFLELPPFLLGMFFIIKRRLRWKNALYFYFLIYPLLGPVFSLDWSLNYWIIKPMLLAVEIYGLMNLLGFIYQFRTGNHPGKV